MYRKISVRKGFPVDGELSIGLYNDRVFGPDFQVAELIMNLRPYLVSVASTAQMFEVEAELPMTNKKLYEILSDHRSKRADAAQLQRALAEATAGGPTEEEMGEMDDGDFQKAKKAQVKVGLCRLSDRPTVENRS